MKSRLWQTSARQPRLLLTGRTPPPSGALYGEASDMRLHHRQRRIEALEATLGEPRLLDRAPDFPVRMAAVADQIPEGAQPMLDAAKPRSARRGHMLDEHELAARFQNAQHFL